MTKPTQIAWRLLKRKLNIDLSVQMFWNSVFCALCMLAVFLIASFRVVPLLLFAWYKIEPKPTEENLSCKSPRKEAMELIVITMLCIGLLILLTPCASLQIQLQPWHGQGNLSLSLTHTCTHTHTNTYSCWWSYFFACSSSPWWSYFSAPWRCLWSAAAFFL